MHKVELLEFRAFGEPERRKRLTKDALRMSDLPLLVSLTSYLIEEAGKASVKRGDFVRLVCVEIDFPSPGGDRVLSAPKHMSLDEDVRERRSSERIGEARDE